MPFKKHQNIRVDQCKPAVSNATMAKVGAFNKLAHDCGMEDILASTWVERLRTVMPHTGGELTLLNFACM